MEPFKINVEESVLIDLKQRLANTRWPGEITDSSWQYGTNLAYVKELCDYWLNEFDWRAQEQRINSFSNFVASVSGLNVHFIYEKGKGPNSIPLIITHGWPSTFAEMVDIPEEEQKNYPAPGGSYYTRRYDTENSKVYDLFIEAMTEMNKKAKADGPSEVQPF